VLVIAELRRGSLLLRRRDPESASRLDTWISDLEAVFADRVRNNEQRGVVPLDIIMRIYPDIRGMSLPLAALLARRVASTEAAVAVGLSL
jgi:hypothetical protein